ncbi:MAG: DUF779 domain-containing protein [Methylotenera sp.]|jgi:uncharacterized protein|nr:DUF779 domain-containing protein [Methylotenera sp.]
MTATLSRVQATPAALQLIAQLRAAHGAILFYQSHGCCAGSAPMCFTAQELGLSEADRCLGVVGGVPVYASQSQCDYLAGLAMTLDVAPGDSGSFGLEDGSGQHFVAHLRLWTDDELPHLAPITPALGAAS